MAGRYRYGLGWHDEAAFVRLLLDAGANPKAKASLRREVQYDDKQFVHEHRDATPPTWGRDFLYKLLVSRRGMELVSILKTGNARAIRFSTLDAICEALSCQPGDILRFEPEQAERERPAAARKRSASR